MANSPPTHPIVLPSPLTDATHQLDRTSLSFASLQMMQRLGFAPSVLGIGGGLFFWTYCMLQVPANLACSHFGIRVWLSGLLFAWGAVASATATVHSPAQFYVLRLALGAAESGCFPGVWYALSLWFPPDRLAVPYSLVGVAVACSQIVAAPLAAMLLGLDGLFGLDGWQLVFLAEGLPSIMLGALLPWLVPAGLAELEPGQRFAGLLSEEQLHALQEDHAAKPGAHRMAADSAPHAGFKAGSGSGGVRTPSTFALLRQVAATWQVWWLAGMNVIKDMAVVGLMSWMPVIINAIISGTDVVAVPMPHGSGHGGGAAPPTGTLAALLSAVPYTFAAGATALSGYTAQRTGQPLQLLNVCSLASSVALLLFPTALGVSRAVGFGCLIAAFAASAAASPHAPVLVAQLTAGPASVLALPAFNSVAMLGGVAGPPLVGYVVEARGGISGVGLAVRIIGGCMLVSAALGFVLSLLWPGADAGHAGGKDSSDDNTQDMPSALRRASAVSGGLEAAAGYELVVRRRSVIDAAAAAAAVAAEPEDVLECERVKSSGGSFVGAESLGFGRMPSATRRAIRPAPGHGQRAGTHGPHPDAIEQTPLLTGSAASDALPALLQLRSGSMPRTGARPGMPVRSSSNSGAAAPQGRQD